MSTLTRRSEHVDVVLTNFARYMPLEPEEEAEIAAAAAVAAAHLAAMEQEQEAILGDPHVHSTAVFGMAATAA